MSRACRTITVIVAPLTAGILAGLLALPAHALTAAQCAALVGPVAPSTTITSKAVIPAGGGLPEYCRVRGHVDTEINFELRLPTTIWNGKFYHAGGGGFAGFINFATTSRVALARGYAVIATDTGHVGAPPAPGLDGSWALNRPDRQLNFGHRAIHVVTLAGKQITTVAYGQAPQYSYFEGCSTGGRQAAMEAQRYPTDFHGIIAGAPALDHSGLMLGLNWNAQVLQGTPLPPGKLAVIANAVLAQCDGKDGLLDGIVENPRRCKFDPAVLACPGGVDGPNCLTSAQVEAVSLIYGGPVNSAREQLHPGFPPGHEDGPTGWQLWISGPTFFGASFSFIIQDHFFRFFVFSDPAYNPLTFDFDTDVSQVAATAELFDATNPDLSAFEAAGGKLLMWHGVADPALTSDRTIQYYNDVAKAVGNKNKIESFFRLFLAPGMHHCEAFAGGPGLNSFDALTALEDWVEGGIAPDAIIASHAGPGVARTRPLCPYPQIAVYDGEGDINDAANFTCKERGLGYSLTGLQSDE
jgi:Tannase and feruloyl esterase